MANDDLIRRRDHVDVNASALAKIKAMKTMLDGKSDQSAREIIDRLFTKSAMNKRSSEEGQTDD